MREYPHANDHISAKSWFDAYVKGINPGQPAQSAPHDLG